MSNFEIKDDSIYEIYPYVSSPVLKAMLTFFIGTILVLSRTTLDDKPVETVNLQLFSTEIKSPLSENNGFALAGGDMDADEKISGALNCRNPDSYSFAVVENPNRKYDSDPLIPKDLNILSGDKITAKIELPNTETKNFSLNSVEKDKQAFEIKIDWGGGVFHYEIQFNFRCRGNNFYLYRVKKKSFSTSNPDSGNFLDKEEIKEIKIEPNLPLEKFVMSRYL